MEAENENGLVLLLKAFAALTWAALRSFARFLVPSYFLSRKSVAGEIVLITGAGSGIGRLLALRFALLGARLVLWDINEETNNETKRLVEELGAEAQAYTVDLSSREQIYAIADSVKRNIGDVNILVNNAGIVQGRKLLESSDQLIDKTFAVNSVSHFFMVKAFVGQMIDSNHGHIVELASQAGKFGTASMTDYCASKFAVIGFASALAAELRSLNKPGVHVSTICPYLIDTEMFRGTKSCSPWTIPILKADYVADSIVDAVLTNTEILYLPRICGLFTVLQELLPRQMLTIIEDYYRINHTMDGFAH